MNQFPVAIKNGSLARALQEHIPNLQVIPSKTRTGEFPDNTVVIRPHLWAPTGMNDPDIHKAINLRFTLRNVNKPKTPDDYEYDRKVHLDLIWYKDGWHLMPALASGSMPLDIYKQFQTTVDYLIAIITNVAEQQKGS